MHSVILDFDDMKYITDPDSINEVLMFADNAIQYGEDADVVEPRQRDNDDGDGGGDDGDDGGEQ